jgi:hypothetical protein
MATLCIEIIAMTKRFRKFMILCAILTPILAFVILKLFFVTGIHDLSMGLFERMRTNQDLEIKFRIIFTILIVSMASLCSCSCFKIAAKKKLDPWRWAKYGFFFNIWAIVYLVFFFEDKGA